MRLTRVTAQVVVLLALLLSFPTPATAEDALQEKVGNVLDEEGLTGIAWALIHAPDRITTGATGLSDNRTGVKFRSDTRFHVGSIAKSLVATGILRLATEGRVGLDDPVQRYLPDLFPDAPPAGFPRITVRHLLDHTAGLNDAHLWQIFSERANADAPLMLAFPEPENQLQLRATAGTTFSYSNMGYTLLGMAIESIVGERYETYLDRQLLAPLSMHDSSFRFVTQQGPHADPALAWGHVDDGSIHAATPMFLRPAGQFTTTAADLALYMQFLLSDGRVGGQPFVDALLMRARGIPVETEAATAGLKAGYALGLGRRDRHGKVGYCHGGNIVGFVAMLCIFPDEQKAFAYGVNTDSETADYGRLDRLFIDTLDIAAATPPATADSAPDVSGWLGHYVLSPNRFRLFEYLDTLFGSIRVSAAGDLLEIVSLQRETRQLRPVGNHVYSANDRTTASHVLLRGRGGEYRLSDGFVSYQRVPSVYLVAHWTSMTLGLTGILWTLIAGSICLTRTRHRHRPVAPAWLVSMLLFLPIPFFLNQSFMALGDMTLASSLLALTTFLLPVGMLATLILVIRSRNRSKLIRLHGVAAVFVLQWCAVLATANLLPFAVWA